MRMRLTTTSAARSFLLIALFAFLALQVHAGPAIADPADLIVILKSNADITGNVVLGLEARERLAEIGRQDPSSVVPLIVAELSLPRVATLQAQQQRIALMGVLQDMGPAAEAAVNVLTEIAQDAEERNEWVVFQARGALAAIGTPAAKAENKAAATATAESWAASASDAEARRTAAQHAYFIRRELRGRRPADGVIGASVTSLRALGSNAADAVPTLLSAYDDSRLGPALREELAVALKEAGVADVAAAAEHAKVSVGEPDLIGAVIADTRSPHELVNQMAMGELARLGSSPRSVDALIEALRAGRSPGAAAAALGDFGQEAAVALPALLPFLDDETVGPNAIQAVARIGRGDPAIVSALRRILRDRNSSTRGSAAKALGALGAAEAIPDLIGVLSDPRKWQTILVANALGTFGAEAKEAVGALAELLNDPDVDIRRAATEALGRIGPPAAEVVPLIARQLESGDARLEESAARALERIGGAAAEAAFDVEAERHAAADRAEYRRLCETGAADDVWRFLRELSGPRRLQLAELAVGESDPTLAMLGLRIYIEAGRHDAAVAAMVDLIVRDDRGLETLTALDVLLSEFRGPDERAGWWLDVATRLKADYTSYPAEVQARVRRALEALGVQPE